MERERESIYVFGRFGERINEARGAIEWEGSPGSRRREKGGSMREGAAARG